MSAEVFSAFAVPRGSRSRLARYFEHNPGRLMDKWMHYFDIYERHFDPFRRMAPTVLEIGVSHGGSLQMWRHYFGRRARIVGVDVEPRVKRLEERGIAIEIGDQRDRAFMGSIASEHGPFDIVIDDGSHRFDDQIASLEVLWPHVRDGGVYLIEDLHTSYWADGYGGGLGVESTFIEWLKRRIDDLHADHSRSGDFVASEWTRSVRGIHLYDSIAVLDKGRVPRPEKRMTGVPAFDTTYGYDTERFIDDAHRAQIEAIGRPTARIGRLVREPIVTTRRVLARTMAKVPRSRR